MASDQSNFVKKRKREVVREEVSRLLGSKSTTSNSPATGNELSHESNNKRTPVTPQTQSSDCPCISTPRTRTLSFEEFYKLRESQRQSGFKVSKKKKKGLLTTSNAPKKLSNYPITNRQLLTEVNDKMAEATSNLSFSQPSASQMHTLQRHRDILKDYSQEFTKTKANIEAFIEREELLGSGYKSSGGVHRKTDLYLKENDHIRNSDRLADEAIGIAMATKENMSRQRGALYQISNRMGGITNRFPALNNLMQKINLRKRRDAIILSIVIAVCLILLILYATR